MSKCKPIPEDLIFGRDYVLENGKVVFTAEYLLKRGSCCDMGCKNCPYDLLKD